MAPADLDGGLFGPQRNALQVSSVVADRDAPGQAVEADRRIPPPERRVVDLDREVHRLIFEGQLRVEAIDAIWHVEPRDSDWIVDDDRRVADPDRADGDGVRGSLPIGFAFLLLDQPRYRPGIAFAAQSTRRLVEPDSVDEQSLREDSKML